MTEFHGGGRVESRQSSVFLQYIIPLLRAEAYEKGKPKALEIRKGRVNGIPGTFMLPRVHKVLNAQVGLR